MGVRERAYQIRAEPPIDEGNIEKWDRATEALVERIENILGGLHALELETMTKAIDTVLDKSEVSDSKVALAKKLTKQQYSQQKAVELEMISLLGYFKKRRELLQNAIADTEVANLLGATDQNVRERCNKKSLLAVEDNGVWKFPLWQFDPSASDGVIPGLPEVLNVLEGSEFTKLHWLTSQNPYLNNLTPVEALKQGQKAKVIKEAKALEAW